MVVVLTIISLVMFFVLTAKQNESGKNNYAEMEVNYVELILYIVTTISVLVAMSRLRSLKYERKPGTIFWRWKLYWFADRTGLGHGGMGLDNTLLTVAQTGMFIYSMFSIIGWYFTMEDGTPVGLIADIFAFVQTCLQVLFV